MSKIFYKSLLRRIKNNKFFFLIEVLGLSIGLVSSFLAALWLIDVYSYDKFHSDHDNIYRIVTKEKIEGSYVKKSQTPQPLAEFVVKDFKEVNSSTRIYNLSEALIKYNDQQLYGLPRLVDSSFFQIFDFPILRGNKNQLLSNSDAIVLSEAFATKLFGEEDPMNKIIESDYGWQYLVSGVVKIPVNSTIQFDYLKLAEPSAHWKSKVGNLTYIQLYPETDLKEFKDNLAGYLNNFGYPHNSVKLELQSLTDIKTNATYTDDYIVHVDANKLYLLLIAGIIVFVVSVINFINLSVAKFHNRIAEVSIKKVFGASINIL